MQGMLLLLLVEELLQELLRLLLLLLPLLLPLVRGNPSKALWPANGQTVKPDRSAALTAHACARRSSEGIEKEPLACEPRAA